MPVQVITTVGASIFANCLKDEGIEKDVLDVIEQAPLSEWEKHKVEIEDIKSGVKKWLNRPDRSCAEISSLEKIAEKVDEIEVHFLTTDTIASKLAAQILCNHFSVNNLITCQEGKIQEVNGLQVKNRDDFEKNGLPHLLEKIQKITEGYGKENCALNITGGYKATIPFLTIVAQTQGIPIYYSFEDSERTKYQLLKMPRLPISINWQTLFEFSKNFEEIDNGSVEIKEWVNYKRKNNLPNEFDDFYMELHGMGVVCLNGIGTFVAKELQSHFFVSFPLGCPLFSEEVTKKRSVEESIIELQRRLDTITDDFSVFKDVDIKHAKVGFDTWIYKHSNPQIRLHYRYDASKKNLIVFNYLFILSKSDDLNYKSKFEREMPFLDKQQLQIIGFKKAY